MKNPFGEDDCGGGELICVYLDVLCTMYQKKKVVCYKLCGKMKEEVDPPPIR